MRISGWSVTLYTHHQTKKQSNLAFSGYYYSTVHHAWKHIMAGSYTTCCRTNMPRKGHVCRNPSNNIVAILPSNHTDLAFVFTHMKYEHLHRVNAFPPIVPGQTIAVCTIPVKHDHAILCVKEPSREFHCLKSKV